MVRGAAGRLGGNSAKLQFGPIELLNKDVDDENRIILANPIFQAFSKKCALTAIYALNKAFHLSPPQITRGNHNARINSAGAFLHSQGQWSETPISCR
jgi:hypothetical protein